jgi:hypothetical protein
MFLMAWNEQKTCSCIFFSQLRGIAAGSSGFSTSLVPFPAGSMLLQPILTIFLPVQCVFGQFQRVFSRFNEVSAGLYCSSVGLVQFSLILAVVVSAPFQDTEWRYTKSFVKSGDQIVL